jgi:hypothetical protein
VTQADKILKDLDKALSSLDKPDFDLKKTCDTVNKACKFLVGIIEQNAKEKVAPMYEKYFNDVMDVYTGKGWYEDSNGIDVLEKYYP